MPLIHGKSSKAFQHNVKAEMEAHPGPSHRAQNLAIAYAIKRKAQHKAHGGMVHKDHKEKHHEGHHEDVEHLHQSKHEDQEMQMHPEYEEQMAHGGMIETEHHDHDFPDKDHYDEEFASGYQPFPHPEVEDGNEHDVVARAMKHYSQGGRIANEGEDKLDHMADGQPNEFDELAKDDDLEFNYDAANSGDELGNHHLDEEDHDVVARAMRSFAKKDKLPKVR